MRHTFLHFLIFSSIFYACLGGASIAEAATHVPDGLLLNDNTLWNASGSPYIIHSNFRIPEGYHLTIGPGVEVTSDASPDALPSFDVDGTLTVEGTSASPVTMHNLASVFAYHANLNLSHTLMDLPYGILSVGSHVTIASSSVSHANWAMTIQNSVVKVSDSRISDNASGILVEPIPHIFPAYNIDMHDGKGGIGNALEPLLAEATDIPATSSVTIVTSSLVNNAARTIKNTTSDPVTATHNWWGSSAGPSALGTTAIAGPVVYDPWLSSDPDAQPCCSSVLFIPGIESSRLAHVESRLLGLLGTTTRQLWEPLTNTDVSKLYLTATGSSTDLGIYSGGPIDVALGIKDVYGIFMNYLDNIVRAGTIRQWRSFGYDWRKSIPEVVQGTERKATTTESLVDVVRSLAADSLTGKVSIIAHSNGGLVAKMLVKVLSDLGQSNLIDSVISVAVPYLGTPQAIGALLHGDNQAIGSGFILTRNVARGLAANMSSAYTLLPSRTYFDQPSVAPTIAFASTSVAKVNSGSYPQKITTYADQTRFITNADQSRSNGAFGEISLPIKGNVLLSAAADTVHGILDPFSWPSSIARWAIIGYNSLTTSGLTYSDNAPCSFQPLGVDICITQHASLQDKNGDGTVVTSSASYNAGTPVAVDLSRVSASSTVAVDHSNILGAYATDATIGTILAAASSASSETINKINAIPGVKVGLPPHISSDVLVVSTHSPVDLNVYDSNGRHVGPIPLPANLDVPDSAYESAYEANIPGSSYETYDMSDGTHETYVHLPDDRGKTYSVVMKGTGIGSFTYNVERQRNGQVVDRTEYANLPVTPLTVASTSLSDFPATSSQSLPLASSTAPILIDLNGDGVSEITATTSMAKAPLDPHGIIHARLLAMRATVLKFCATAKRCADLTKRIDHLEDLNNKGKLKLNHRGSGLWNLIGHRIWKKMTATDSTKMLNSVDQYVSQFE